MSSGRAFSPRMAHQCTSASSWPCVTQTSLAPVAAIVVLGMVAPRRAFALAGVGLAFGSIGCGTTESASSPEPAKAQEAAKAALPIPAGHPFAQIKEGKTAASWLVPSLRAAGVLKDGEDL